MLLLLESSGRGAAVGIADGTELRAVQRLPEARRHARDLAATVRELACAHAGGMRGLSGILVSLGPGSYTGLRVGLMSAKALAYALKIPLFGIETFAIIAEQTPSEFTACDVLADAQQERIFVQRFHRDGVGFSAAAPICIEPLREWLGAWSRDAVLTGPGVTTFAEQLPPDAACAALTDREPRIETMLRIYSRCPAGWSELDPQTVEPLYLRGSYAEVDRTTGR